MVGLKTQEEIELLRENNLLVSKVLGELKDRIKPGVTTGELDAFAEEYIRDHGAVPAFLGYQGFPKSLCTSVNDQVVHGIPSDCVLKDGDIISVDCGVLMNNYVGDTAYTFGVGEIDDEKKQLLKVTKEALFKGIEQAKVGNRVGDIGHAIQSYVEPFDYGIVREMVGHGIGQQMHEKPEIPNYGKKGVGPKLKEGTVICIEPMINAGKRFIRQEDDGWTIKTSDAKPSAHFELAIAVVKEGPDILSTFNFIEEKN